MKTVIDAVNELRGDLSNSAKADCSKYLKYSLVTGAWLCSRSSIANHSYDDVCTTEEFLATVAECETNFGECEQSYSDYMSEWEYVQEFKLKSTPTYTQEMSNLGARLTKKPLFDVPIFTQAMADNGVSPSVGMEFICGDEMANDERTVEFKGVKVKVIGVSAMGKDKVITFCHESLGVGCGIFFSSWVKPLTPPITLIDGKAYQFYIEGFLALGFYREDRKSFFSCGNKVCGLSEADEIQPLTVEVK